VGTHSPEIAYACLPNWCTIEVNFHFVSVLLSIPVQELDQALLVVQHAQAQARDLRNQVMSVDDVIHFTAPSPVVS
jgi:hypothetical protein